MSDMHHLTPENQGVTGIDPTPSSKNQEATDVDEEFDQEDFTYSYAFQEAEVMEAAKYVF